jgi:hypothetical protein
MKIIYLFIYLIKEMNFSNISFLFDLCGYLYLSVYSCVNNTLNLMAN